MREYSFSFLLRLLFFSGIVFGLHLFVLDFLQKDLFGAKIREAYTVNIVLAVFVYFTLYFFRRKFKNQLGFLFLLGSLIKFLIFFLLFNGDYKADDYINPQEFFAFFTPYVLTLIIEVYSLSRWMNKLDD